MSARSLGAWLPAVALVALYGFRAIGGIVAGWAHDIGRRAYAAEEWERAATHLERSAVGVHRAADAWYAGQAWLGVVQQRVDGGGGEAAVGQALGSAYREFTRAIAASPASGWYWAALADVYLYRERLQRREHGVSLDSLGADPLGGVGRSGRIALGLLRVALDREPNGFAFHDQMALLLLELGATEAALEAVRNAARVQPLFDLHALARLDPRPPEVLRAFAEGSRAGIESTPLLRRVDHWIALGRLELMRGDPAQAERDLEAAAPLAARRVKRAEVAFLRGVALEGLGRHEEARQELRRAASHPIFERSALDVLVRVAEAEGDAASALDTLYALRRLAPADLDVLMRFAVAAQRTGRHDLARQALETAIDRHPVAVAPRELLIGLCLEAGELPHAERVLADLERSGLDPGAAAGLRQRLERLRSP